MRIGRSVINSLLLGIYVAGALLAVGQFPGRARAAEIAANFTLPNRKTGQELHLYDYAGQIILLEFFYHWCPHCQAATPDIKANLANYYDSRGGNPAGLPVTEIYINLESNPGDQAATDAFIQRHNLEIVADDFSAEVFFGFDGEGTPHLVVINGVTNSSTHQPWEILYNRSGYTPATTVPALRYQINSVDEILPPTVAITSPPQNARVGSPTIKLLGTATDNVGVDRVEYQLNQPESGPFQRATGTVSWSASMVLSLGTNTVRVKSVDLYGNESPLITSTFVFDPTIESISPTVAIRSPAPNTRFTNAMITVQGTAKDNVNVARVEYQLNSGSFEAVTDGTTNWSASLLLLPGTNTVRFKSVDATGNESALVTRNFILLSPLTVLTNGIGKVTPNLNGKFLDVGKRYTITAMPGVGQVFSNWTEGIFTNTARLSFIMQPDLVLQANFVPNPFIPVKGIYNGLFYDTNDILHESSGFFTATLTDRATYTARLLLGGKTHAFTGQFDLEGKSMKSVPRPGTNALTVDLQLDLASGSDRMTGHVSNGNWMAELWADRAKFHAVSNPATNFAGKYTFVIPSGTNAAASPGGDGFGTATVSAAGTVTMSGTLADDTRIAQTVPLSKNGQWPLYVALYAGKGSLLSWVTFTNSPADDFNGLLSWIKPVLVPPAKFYRAGFTNETTINGSRYTPPVGTTNRVLNFTNGIVTFTDGNLGQSIINVVTLQANNKVINNTNASPNKLVLTIVPSTGLFNGTVLVPGTNKIISFKGALHQKQNFGAGFFLGTNQSGRVFFGPNP